MADSGELARRGSASSGKGHLADVEEMRVQISKLQEQKAEALNRQVVELQTENDKVVGRMKLLQKTLEELTMELTTIKEAHAKVSSKAAQLERNLFEEQLRSSELKRKLQLSNKQNAHLKSEVKIMKNRLAGNSSSLLQESLDMDSSGEGKQSLNNSEDDVQKQMVEREDQEKQFPPHPTARDVSLAMSTGVTSPLVRSTVATVCHSHNSSSAAASSPSMGPKRYKLSSSEALKTTSVQTETPWPEDYVDRKTFEAAKSDLEMEKTHLEKKVRTLTLENQKSNKEYKMKLNKKIKEIRSEQKVLSTGLAEFSAWGKSSLQSLEDDIDMCRVVYSLHGSMSQETQLIEDLQEKLKKCEQKKRDEEALCKYLKENIDVIETQLKHSKRQNELLKEKLLLLTPVKSSKQSFYSQTSSPSPPRRTTRSPQAVRSTLAQPQALLRLASTPQATRSAHNAATHSNVRKLPFANLSPEHSADKSHKQSRNDHMQQENTENTNFNRSDAKGDKAKCGQRGVSEKLVMDGDKWYTVPDDDDDESEV